MKTLKLVTFLLASVVAVAAIPAKGQDVSHCISFKAKSGFDRIYNSCDVKIYVKWRTHDDDQRGLGSSLTSVSPNDYANVDDWESEGGVSSWAACAYPKAPSSLRKSRVYCR